jgi:adenylylsulfate kinase
VSGLVVWFTGLPSSGKTTLARAVKNDLEARGMACCLLDSDEVRSALHPQPGYDSDGRGAFYATLASLAALLARQGIAVLVAATAHRKAYRAAAQIVAPRFVEVFVDTPLEECERRDAKGLYRRGRAAEITAVPGIHTAYEPPSSPDVVAKGGSSDEAVAAVVAVILASRAA